MIMSSSLTRPLCYVVGRFLLVAQELVPLYVQIFAVEVIRASGSSFRHTAVCRQPWPDEVVEEAVCDRIL